MSYENPFKNLSDSYANSDISIGKFDLCLGESEG